MLQRKNYQRALLWPRAQEDVLKIEGIAAGTRLVTMSGDIVELLEITDRGRSARVRFVEVLSGSEGSLNSEASMSNDDIATFDGNRFVGPPQTSSTSGA